MAGQISPGAPRIDGRLSSCHPSCALRAAPSNCSCLWARSLVGRLCWHSPRSAGSRLGIRVKRRVGTVCVRHGQYDQEFALTLIHDEPLHQYRSSRRLRGHVMANSHVMQIGGFRSPSCSRCCAAHTRGDRTQAMRRVGLPARLHSACSGPFCCGTFRAPLHPTSDCKDRFRFHVRSASAMHPSCTPRPRTGQPTPAVPCSRLSFATARCLMREILFLM